MIHCQKRVILPSNMANITLLLCLVLALASSCLSCEDSCPGPVQAKVRVIQRQTQLLSQQLEKLVAAVNRLEENCDDQQNATVIPPQEDICSLPIEPAPIAEEGDAVGTRFGGHPESRQEYDTIPGGSRVRGEFSLEFRTTASDGVLFYVANVWQVDLVSLYLQGGQLGYIFNSGTGMARLLSPEPYNDDTWHKVVLWRDQRRGKLIIDGREVLEGHSGGTARTINVDPPYIVGGLSNDQAAAAASNLLGNTAQFIGCIRDLRVNNESFGEPSREFFTRPCSSGGEAGSFFYSDGGYIKIFDSFKVNIDLDISIEVRPRSLSGVILSVASPKGDYLVIQMVNGEIIFSIDNGAGEIKSTYTHPVRNEMCNGQWHRIQAVKAKNVATITVDDVSLYSGIGEAGVSSTDTDDPLYIGGVPESHRGIKTTQQFVGCIRNLKLNDEAQNLAVADASGHVSLSSCPAN